VQITSVILTLGHNETLLMSDKDIVQ